MAIVWLTETELASSYWLNSAEHAKIAITTMTPRPHSTNEGLAKAGIKEYKHFVKRTELEHAITQGASVTHECDLSADQYTSVRDHMSDVSNPGNTKPSTTTTTKAAKRPRHQDDKPVLEVSPEQKQRRDVITAATKVVTTLKTTHEKITREMAMVDVIEARLKKKPWDTTQQVKYIEIYR